MTEFRVSHIFQRELKYQIEERDKVFWLLKLNLKMKIKQARSCNHVSLHMA